MSSPNPPCGATSVQLCQQCKEPLASNEVRCESCGYSNLSVPVLEDMPTQVADAAMGQLANVPMLESADILTLEDMPTQVANAVMGQPANVPMVESAGIPMEESEQEMVARPAKQGLSPSPDRHSEGLGQLNAPMDEPGQTMAPGPTAKGFGPSPGIYDDEPSQQKGDGNLYSSVSSQEQSNDPGNSVSSVNRPSVVSSLFMPQEGPNVRRIVILIVILLLVIAGSAGAWQLVVRGDVAVSMSPIVTSMIVPNTTPLFADQFNKGNINGWNTLSVANKYSVNIQQNALTLESDENMLLQEFIPGTRTFSNFQLFVDARLTQGDENNGYGVYIRGGANQYSRLATYYCFELYGDGTFAIFKGELDTIGKTTYKKIIDYIYNSLIKRGGTPKEAVTTPFEDKAEAVNHISIIAKESTMVFSVNGQMLATITDASYASGSIALFVSNLPEAKPGAQAMFSSLGIYPVDAQ